MTNMIHKSPADRRARNNRYVAAINPLREMFHCTAMELAGHVRKMLADNRHLTERVKSLEKDISEMTARQKELTTKLEAVTAELLIARTKED